MSNGKGDTIRPYNKKKYDQNYESIDWNKKELGFFNVNFVMDRKNKTKKYNLTINFNEKEKNENNKF